MMQSKRFRALAMVGLWQCVPVQQQWQRKQLRWEIHRRFRRYSRCQKEWMCHLFLLNSH